MNIVEFINIYTNILFNNKILFFQNLQMHSSVAKLFLGEFTTFNLKKLTIIHLFKKFECLFNKHTIFGNIFILFFALFDCKIYLFHIYI